MRDITYHHINSVSLLKEHNTQLYYNPFTLLQKIARYQCPLCTRVFRKASLRCHLRTHTQERPFVCKFCYRGFGHRSSMISHVKQEHRGETGYVCDVCTFRTANKASMDRHRLIHTQRNKPFLCAVCGANFFLK
jgi:rubrerythrin